MAIYKTSTERPRERKRFLTARQVEDMAAANVSEIAYSPGLVITDAAREMAIDLGIRIVPEAEKRRNANESKSGANPLRQETDDNARPSESLAAHGRVKATVQGSAGTRRLPDVHGGNPWKSEDALVRAVVDAIQARWRPVRRYSRQLLDSDKS